MNKIFKTILKAERELGERLLRRCPGNDCILYKDIYMRLINLKIDYDINIDLTETTKALMKAEAQRLISEIDKLFFYNRDIKREILLSGGRERKMTRTEAKEAMRQRAAIRFNGINYSFISAIIYRSYMNGNKLSEDRMECELYDKCGHSVTIAMVENIERI